MSVASLARVIGRRVFRQSFVLICEAYNKVNPPFKGQGDSWHDVLDDSKTCIQATVERALADTGNARRENKSPRIEGQRTNPTLRTWDRPSPRDCDTFCSSHP